jgi:hypothetical protein
VASWQPRPFTSLVQEQLLYVTFRVHIASNEGYATVPVEQTKVCLYTKHLTFMVLFGVGDLLWCYKIFIFDLKQLEYRILNAHALMAHMRRSGIGTFVPRPVHPRNVSTFVLHPFELILSYVACNEELRLVTGKKCDHERVHGIRSYALIINLGLGTFYEWGI